MRIHPLFKWFGSKWGGSKHYPKPIYNTIVETHAGSAGYALNYSDRDIVLYDTNENVWALWEWLINFASYNPVAVKDIPINIPEGTDIRTLGLTTGQELLLKHWQRTNNVGNCWTISPWGNKPGQWTANTRARVSEEVQAVRHWKICSKEPVWEEGCTFFVDPPYRYNYNYGCKNFNWDELGERIKSHKNSQFIVCEARCPKTGQMPTWLPFVDFRKQVTSRRKTENNHHSSEVIYTVDGGDLNASKTISD